MKSAIAISFALQALALGQATASPIEKRGNEIGAYIGAVNCVNGNYKSSEVWVWETSNGGNFPYNPDLKVKIADWGAVTWETNTPISFGPAQLNGKNIQGNFYINQNAFSQSHDDNIGKVDYTINIPIPHGVSTENTSNPMLVKEQQLDLGGGWTCWMIYANKS
ncbi:hypothetical protein HDU87_000856 [Geranomyces variabilis]|uniref:Uncharacterized protein n=1 Tax=Geranomyces variabilis TaxID=109894 RepID=A0AAD5XNP8_9FUNG|nr:hypothetical protein HDU87_000856 [Geranomyces variabilis]